jgi:hypothetical protein
MKKILFALLALTAFFSADCTKENAQIFVRFQNTLTQDITDARMEFGDTHITDVGVLPAGGVTDYIVFDYFEVGDDWPMGYLKGKKGDADFSAWSGLWCGTGVEFKQLEPGYYTVEVVQFGTDSTGFFQMRFVE